MRKASSKNCSKTKGGKTSETLTDINGEAEGGNSGFYACYLLTSLSPRHKGHTYIGFTVNPKRRIRQHNGEITMGATRTKKKRPWEMVLCIYGFPTQVAALQFEWAWQHPTESLAVRNAACNLKSLNGLPNKIKVGFTMLTLHTWQSMDLTVNFFSTKYMSHVATCPSLPRQMKVQFGSMDDLPCYSSGNQSLHNDENDWDLDPQDSSGSDGIEDLSRGNANSVDENTHCFDATDTTTSSSTENQASQENHVVEPRDPFFLAADDDFQKHFDEVEHLNREYNTPMHDSAEKPANNRTTCMVTENDGCSQDLPFEGRSPLHKRDSIFLIEDDFQEQFNQVDHLDQESNTRCLSTEDSGCNLVHPFEGRSSLPRGATDETQSSTFREIEVIDLFTPSPSCKDKLDNTRSKKRKVGSANTDVIDLTRSPDFVQL